MLHHAVCAGAILAKVVVDRHHFQEKGAMQIIAATN